MFLIKNKARVLLITPNLKGVKDGLNRIQPPLGLMIAAAVMIRNGHIVKIHDTALQGWDNRTVLNSNIVMIGQSDDDIRGIIENFSPDIIGISALFSNLMDSTHQIASIAKEVNKDIKVILGGNHISSAISDYLLAVSANDSSFFRKINDLEDQNIDYAMYGEVDFEFPRLIDALIRNQSIDNIKGLAWKNHTDENFHINEPPSKIDNLDLLPHPARGLVDMEAYFDIGAFHSPKSKSKRVLSIMASRGCPEKCTFCTTPNIWGAKVRWRSVNNIITEIKRAVNDFNIGELQFEDDTITARKSNLMELCAELEKIGLPWCTPNGVKADYHLSQQLDMFKAMADSGCYQITLACETGVQGVMDNIVKKNLNINSIRPAINNAKKAGMLVHTFWILGFPGETYDEMLSTIDFALESGADSYSFAILSPLPGTSIYRDVVKNNLFWNGTDISDLMYRSSIIKVDGFDCPEDFEKFVTDVNFRANNMLLKNNPERFKRKYGNSATLTDLIKQT